MNANYLIVGLGNHGIQHQKHRHNIGYIILDSLCNELHIEYENKKFSSIFGVKKVGLNKYFFQKPETYMNNSGISVQQLKDFYKINIQNIIAIHDEIDLACGKCKIKSDCSDNGHNGLKSIDSHCGKKYFRLRVGVERPKIKEMEISSYVLSDLSDSEINHAKKIGQNLGKNFIKLFDEKNQSIVLNEISKIS